MKEKREGINMGKMISFGANFVKYLDEYSGNSLIFKCKVEAIPDDRVIEQVKELVEDVVENESLSALFELYKMGWYLHSVEE